MHERMTPHSNPRGAVKSLENFAPRTALGSRAQNFFRANRLIFASAIKEIKGIKRSNLRLVADNSQEAEAAIVIFDRYLLKLRRKRARDLVLVMRRICNKGDYQ
jgi:hypothetical protein